MEDRHRGEEETIIRDFLTLRVKHTTEKESLRRKRRQFEAELTAADKERAIKLHQDLRVLDELAEFAKNRDRVSKAAKSIVPGPEPLLPLCPAEALFPTVGSVENWDFLVDYPKQPVAL